MADELARLRREYAGAGLDETDAGDDPVGLFARWLADAVASGMHEPNAMTVTTVDASGAPTVRLVLLKQADARGFCFFTNYGSRKSTDLAADPRCALLFPWHPVQRQVRVERRAERVPSEESDAYFAVRPRDAQLGAWASPQSQPVAGREALDAAYAEAVRRFADVEVVPRPPHWGGWLVVPSAVEFWQGRAGRMHDRLRFDRAGAGWVRTRLAP